MTSTASSIPMENVGLPIGSSAIDFQLEGTDRKKYSLESFQDKQALAIVFSCNHCPYAQAYEQRLIQLQNDYKNKSLVLVAINSNDDTGYPEDSFPNMVKRAKEHGFNFPYLRDESQDIARKYGAICTPHVFLFDKNRHLQYKGRVDDNWRDSTMVKSPDLRNAIDNVLQDKTPTVQETRPYGCSIKWKH